MKQFLLLAVLNISIEGTWAQNSTQQMESTSTSHLNDYWDLNKYVWSHTHPLPVIGKKAILDFNAIENSIGLGNDDDLSISPDGKYFAYSIQKTMYRRRDTLNVQPTTTTWRRSFTDARSGFFSGNSKLYIFQHKEDLCFLQTANGETRYAKGVASYKRPDNDKGKWLAYQLKNPEATLIIQELLTEKERYFQNVSKYGFDQSGQWLFFLRDNKDNELIIYNLATGTEQHFQSVVSYLFNANGTALVLKTIEKTNAGVHTNLQYVNLSNKSMNSIWSTTDTNTSLNSYSFDGSGKQVVFMVQGGKSGMPAQSNNSIWYYRAGMNKAVLKVNNRTESIEAGLFIQGVPAFTDNDQYISFFLFPEETDLRKPNPDAVKVDIWSYKDLILQSTQPYLLKLPPKSFKAVFHIEGSRVIRLEKEYETWKRLKGDFAVIAKSGREINGDRFWEKGYQTDSNWLVSLKYGTRTLLKTKTQDGLWFSPCDKYLVYFDVDQQCNYFSIELSTGKLANISRGVPAWQLGFEDHYLRPREKPYIEVGLAGWLEKDNGLLVYDNYDIWKLDLTGKTSPVNITGGYGRRNHIRFSLTGNGEFGQLDASGMTTPILPEKTPLLLKAFNMKNKFNGVYRKVLGSIGYPELLYMGPYTLEKLPVSTRDIQYTYSYGKNETKAAQTNVWIVKRQSATEAPNYFLTTNFKNYNRLTDLQPHKKYNWLTAELLSFKQLDGTVSQGVLYKPENFDPTKKYPVIIVFYGPLSNQLNVYPSPHYIWAPSAPAWNPGWMVSHGYLVFIPDVYFTKGKWGPSALNTVEGAAKYLGKLPFVDGTRLGACGHSNSGRTAYYILTHSHSFAAMAVGASQSNIISAALSLWKADRNEASYLEWIEKETFGTALGNLWQNKATWLNHTAILRADKVTSPVLLFHNKKDAHPLEQAVGMFIALRRLEKKAWWLQYDDAYHTVYGQDARDFTIRYTQFFDHYLKGAPAPQWMTQGIPARFKQIESRYELDFEGICGKNCPICQARSHNKQSK